MSDLIERLARAICEADKTAPAPDEPIYINMRAAKAWEARVPMAEAVLKALGDLSPSAAASLAEGRGVVVPRNPTVQMYRAAFDELVPCGDAQACWRAMIAASQSKEGDT